jgi:hypothetical protein
MVTAYGKETLRQVISTHNSGVRGKVTKDTRKAPNFGGFCLQRFRTVLWQNCLNSIRKSFFFGEEKQIPIRGRTALKYIYV